jgi:holin-like protein
MVNALALLLALQLAGEVVARLSGLPVPGPVIAAGALAAVLLWRGTVATVLSDTAHGILRNLSLLFVPAAVGVTEHRDVFAAHGVALVITLVVSTLAAMAVAALVFRWVAR